jgi:hypothetical protein
MFVSALRRTAGGAFRTIWSGGRAYPVRVGRDGSWRGYSSFAEQVAAQATAQTRHTLAERARVVMAPGSSPEAVQRRYELAVLGVPAGVPGASTPARSEAIRQKLGRVTPLPRGYDRVDLERERVPSFAETPTPDGQLVSAARRANLLAKTDLGKAILRDEQKAAYQRRTGRG